MIESAMLRERSLGVLMLVASCAAEYLWLKNLLNAFKVKIDRPLKIYEDNQSCIACLTKWEHKRLKHIDNKYFFVKNLCIDRKLNVKYIPTEEQIVDTLTKALPKDKFVKLRTELGMKECKKL